MAEVVSNINLDAHYSSNPKVERPARVVANGPTTIPSTHLFDDNDANKRFEGINRDIYEKTGVEKKKNASNFWKIFGSIVGIILIIKGVRNIKGSFKKS